MANKRVTDLEPITTAPVDGVMHFIDVTDTSQNVAGSSFKITKADLLKELTEATNANTSKVGYTEELVNNNSNVVANTAKVGYTEALVSANVTVAANAAALPLKTDNGTFVGTSKDLENLIVASSTGASGISIVPSSAAPTGTGVASFTATQAGTYTNYGGVVVNANSFAIISRRATGAFSISQTTLTLSASKIQTWAAQVYAIGDQVNHLGKDWTANAATVAGDVPGTSSKWIERLTGYVATNNRISFISAIQAGIFSADGTIASSTARSIITFTTNNASSEYFFTALSPNAGAFIVFYDSANAFIKSLALTTSFQYTNQKISELTTIPSNTFKIAIGYVNTAPVPLLIGDVFLDKNYKGKIQTWIAGAFISGEQVNYLGKDYTANALTVAGDVPGVSPKWVERLSGYVSSDNKTLFTNNLIESGTFDINGNKTSSTARTRIIFTITNKSGEYLLTFLTLPNSAFLVLYDSADVFIKSVTLPNSFQYTNQKLSELTSIPDNLGKIGVAYLNGGTIPVLTGSVFATSLDLLAVKNSVSAIQIFKTKYAKAFTDYFSTQKADWINTTGWNFDTTNKQLIPLANGGFTTNYISLNRLILTDTRLFRTVALVSSTTVMNIMSKGGNGESMYTVNCATGKLQIYGITGNNTLGAVIKEGTIPFTIGTDTKVIIDVAKSDYNYIFTITNFNTLQSVAVTLSGWSGGRQHGLYSYSISSGAAFKILSAVVLLPTGIDILFVGDSITEGFGVESTDTTFAKKYASLVGDFIGPHAISAMAGDTASGIMRFENEYNFIKPKYMSLCIGTNGGGLGTIIASFISKCASINAIPLINYIPITANSTNATIDGLDPDVIGARFDIATALNNNIADGKNNALFVDGVHPNVAGHLLMFNRFNKDLTLTL